MKLSNLIVCRKAIAVACYIVLLAGMSACTGFQGGDPKQAFDAAVADQEYQRAQKILDNIAADHPDYQTLQSQQVSLDKKKQKYESSRIKAVTLLQQDDRWIEAEDTLSLAMKRLGPTERLQQMEERLQSAKQRYLEDLEEQASLARAEGIRREEKAWQSRVNADPSWANKRKLSAVKKEKKQIMEALKNCDERASARGSINRARRCVSAAYNIEASDELEQRLLSLSRKKTNRKNSRNKLDSELLQKEILEYQKAMQGGQWLLAGNKIKTLNRHFGNESRVLELTEDFNEQKIDYIEREMERGQRLYSLGEVEAAFNIWKALQELDPSNLELNERVKRSEHFLKKLERLKSSQ